ncbi:MAG: hypothetical protein ACRDHP_19525, partial [Ktedonobacterales bacterium]
MFDEHQTIQNGHSPSMDAGDTGMLPPDLEVLHSRLTRESAVWALRLPDAEPLVSYARALPGEPVSAIPSAPIRTGSDELEETGAGDNPTPRFPLAPRPIRHMRGRALLGLAAVVAIVALMAAVFANLTPSRVRGPAGGKPTTA